MRYAIVVETAASSRSIVLVSDAQGVQAPTPSASLPSQALAVRVVWVGLAAAAVGLITGLAMALERRVVECADGTFFPEGTTDFRCFEHPVALGGTAVAAISVALGSVIVLAALAIRASRPDEAPTE
jgi:hypothetical protein